MTDMPTAAKEKTKHIALIPQVILLLGRRRDVLKMNINVRMENAYPSLICVMDLVTAMVGKMNVTAILLVPQVPHPVLLLPVVTLLSLNVGTGNAYH